MLRCEGERSESQCKEEHGDSTRLLGEEEDLEGETRVDGKRLDQMSEFKYLSCGLDESSTNVTECRRKVVGGR